MLDAVLHPEEDASLAQLHHLRSSGSHANGSWSRAAHAVVRDGRLENVDNSLGVGGTLAEDDLLGRRVGAEVGVCLGRPRHEGADGGAAENHLVADVDVDFGAFEESLALGGGQGGDVDGGGEDTADGGGLADQVVHGAGTVGVGAGQDSVDSSGAHFEV